MSATGYKYVTKYTSPNQSGDFRAESITIHWWGEPANHRSGRIGGVVNWLCQARAKASAHFVVSGVTGEMAQIVDLDHAAWHAANWTGNHRSIGIEMHPWDSSTPKSQIEADLDAAAYVVALCWHWRPKLKGVKLKGHRDWHNTQCPGSYYPELDEILRRATKIYPRVDPQNPGKLLPATTPTGSEKLIMDKSDEDIIRRIVREESLRGDVVPRPAYSGKDDSNPTWTGYNVLSYILNMTHQTRAHAAAAEALARKAAEKSGVSPDEIRQAVSDALGSLDADVTLTIKEQ